MTLPSPSPAGNASPADTSYPHNDPSGTREKSRTVHACEPCRRLKSKCDGLLPCTRCASAGRGNVCVYGVPIQRKPKAVRSTLARPLVPKPVVPAKRKPSIERIDAEVLRTKNGPEDSKRSTIARPMIPSLSHLGSRDIADSEYLGEGSKSLPDKGHEELRAGVTALNVDTNAYQFYGASSHYSFVQRLYQRIRHQNDRSIAIETRERVPEGLRQWGLEKHLFSRVDDGHRTHHNASDMAYLPRELGDSFIATYFDIMHGQAPILERVEVEKTWQNLWMGPGQSAHTKENALLYMVFAIGARLYGSGVGDIYVQWAEHFFEKAGKNLADVFEETTLPDTQLLLLRGIYATQANKPNCIYLYAGHAARSALALGLHRAQVVGQNNDAFSNRLRLTFWSIYYIERMTSMLAGRPSCLVEEHIDAPLPIDSPNTDYAYIRAMVGIAKVTETVVTANYTPKHAKRVSDLSTINQFNNKCMGELGCIVDTLPIYLRFSDQSTQILDTSREVQRICLGVTYYITQILIFRSALIYATFFTTFSQAQETLGERIDLRRDTDLAVEAAKQLINLAHDGFFRRCSSFQRDGNISFFIISACVTLLFEVLDPAATPAHATDVFHIVEKGLQCLDKIDHVGSTTGRAISLDVMAIAKAALFSTEATTRLESNLVDEFSWLGDEYDMNSLEGFESLIPDAQLGMDVDMGAWMWNVMDESLAGAGFGP